MIQSEGESVSDYEFKFYPQSSDATVSYYMDWIYLADSDELIQPELKKDCRFSALNTVFCRTSIFCKN